MATFNIRMILVNIRFFYPILGVVIFLHLITTNSGFFLGHNQNSLGCIRNEGVIFF